MKRIIYVTFSAIIIILYILYYNNDNSVDRYNSYCEGILEFYENPIKNGEIVSDQVLKNNHNIRKLIIKISNDEKELSIIQSTNDSPLLNEGVKFKKEKDSNILILSDNRKVKILSYCDRFFYVNKNQKIR